MHPKGHETTLPGAAGDEGERKTNRLTMQEFRIANPIGLLWIPAFAGMTVGYEQPSDGKLRPMPSAHKQADKMSAVPEKTNHMWAIGIQLDFSSSFSRTEIALKTPW
ncbi:MAG: hypothetical protein R3B84_24035 [Zavarzinella sp.]